MDVGSSIVIAAALAGMMGIMLSRNVVIARIDIALLFSLFTFSLSFLCSVDMAI